MRNITFGKPILGEEEFMAVKTVLESGVLAHGPNIERFEAAFADFTGSSYVVAVANCTAALHLAYFYMNLGPGDEVIVPAETHTATAHAVELMKAKPVFVDAESRTGNIDISQIESKITSRTKAISVVHYLGMPVDMDKITALAKKHKLLVVEDCALSIGSYYKGRHTGNFGDFGCYSFYPVKHMTTGEGGVVTTNNKEIALALKRQRAFGMDKHVGERTVPGIYDVQGLGFNYRLSEIGAAIGLEQLKRVPGFLEKRKENFQALDAGLRKLSGVQVLESTHGDYVSSYYSHTMILKEPHNKRRGDIIKFLNSKGVGTSVYYPHAVPLMTYYRNKYGYSEKDFPVANWISENSIALPVGPHLGVQDVNYIVETVDAALKN